MIAQAQGLLSQSSSSIKALVGSHPIGLGIVIGIGAYYVVNKYWLNEDEDEEIIMAEESESEEDAPA